MRMSPAMLNRELVTLAAAAEQDVTRWQHRFTALLRNFSIVCRKKPGGFFAERRRAIPALHNCAYHCLYLCSTVLFRTFPIHGLLKHLVRNGAKP